MVAVFFSPFGLSRFPVWRGDSNVEEIVALVDDTLEASAAQGLIEDGTLLPFAIESANRDKKLIYERTA